MPSRSLQDTRTSNQTPVPSHPAADVFHFEAQSDKSLEAAEMDVIKNSVPIHVDKQSDQAKIGSPIREESENELLIVNPAKTNLPSDASQEREQPCDPVLSVSPPAFSCLSNVEPSKHLIDVAAKNLLEPQCSSTPSCPIALAEEENDGRGKELKWLEDLDRALQDKKKNRSTCSFTEQGGISVQASSTRASPTVPAKSLVHSVLDKVSYYIIEPYILRFDIPAAILALEFQS